MIKDKPIQKAYMNRGSYIESGKKLEEEKKQKAIMRKASKPNHKNQYH